MSGKVFLDTNILVYSYSNSEPEKLAIAQKIIESTESVISTQVLQELCNVVTKKLKLGYETAIDVVNECRNNNSLHVNTDTTITLACQLASKYQFSFYDSLIIAAALESECSVLFSEDLADGQVIEKRLTIRNPFGNNGPNYAMAA